MKKKILSAVLAIVSAGCLGVGLTACNRDGGDTGDKWGSVYTVEAAYAEASTLGYGGTLEEFIASISGKDGTNGTNGVGISKIEIVADNLKVTLTDGTVLELGSVKGATGEKGDDGDSAYEIWLNNGHTGTQADFLEWLKGAAGAQGEKGDTGAQGAQGEKGDKGDDGESAYQIWLNNGHTGSQADFLEWLKGGDENPLGLDFYVLDDGTYGVAVGKAKYLSSVEIPSTYNGKTVSVVLENAFISSNVSSVVIPDSVNTIGNNAFSSCSSLESVYYIGTEREWNAIIIGSNENLTEEIIYFYSETEPTTQGNFWHYDTDGKTIIKWQSTEKEEGEEIEYVAGTPGLEYRLGGDVYRCVGLGTATETDITIANYYDGKRVTAVYANAFNGCTSITSVTIPDGILTINSMAFYGCSSLERVSLGNSVKTVGNSSFGNCDLLNYNEYDNAYYLGNGANPYHALMMVKDRNISSCQIKSNTKVISYMAFAGCNSLTAVDVPDTVISINPFAFKSCSALESVSLPEGLIYIGSYAFMNCTALRNVAIPNSLQTLANGVFEGCTSLNFTEYDNALYFGNETNEYIALIKAKSETITSCQINANAKFICDEAFQNCTLLTGIEIPKGVVSIDFYAFSGCTSLESVILPDGLKAIDPYAFENCTSLRELDIPDSVTSSVRQAFMNCSSITSLVIPASVSSVGFEAFRGCTSLASVVISEGVKGIEAQAFKGCTALDGVVIPVSVTYISSYAFEETALESVYFNGTATEWNDIDISATNEKLANATIYYYSATEPTTPGNFWHYAADGKTIVKW